MNRAELDRVLRHYRVGTLQTAEQVERGYVNESWLVITDRGRYFLKRRHPALRQPDRIVAQHSLLHQLKQADFPVPHLHTTTAGRSWLELESEIYELCDCVEAACYDLRRPAHLTAAAQTLGRYHSLAASLAPAALQAPDELYNPIHLHPLLLKLTGNWGEIQNNELVQMLRKLQTHAADLSLQVVDPASLPHVTIHGDYYAGNLLFQGDEIVCVVDWDKARWAPRVVELAEALIYFASPRPGTLQHLVYPGVLQWGPLAQFLHNYAHQITLNPAEIGVLPHIIQCIWLEVSLQRLLEQAPQPAQAEQVLSELLILSEWAREHRQRIRQLAQNAVQAHQEETS